MAEAERPLISVKIQPPNWAVAKLGGVRGRRGGLKAESARMRSALSGLSRISPGCWAPAHACFIFDSAFAIDASTAGFSGCGRSAPWHMPGSAVVRPESPA